jgi:hypothetical protein
VSALEWLAATALMTALFWVPYVLERMVSLGVLGTMKPVDPEDEDELKQTLWARLIHFPAGAFGLTGIRTVAFLVGFGAQVVVALRIFG